MAENNNLTNLAATFKAGSYVQMLKTLYRASMNVPDAIKNTDPAFLRSMSLDIKTAHTLEKIQSEFNPELNQITASVQGKIDQLGTVKATLPFRDSYHQQFNPLKADVLKAIDDHENLLHEIKAVIQTEHATMPTLFQELAENKKTLADVNRVLTELRNRQTDITSATVSLLLNSETLEHKLASLLRETSQTYAAAKGEQYQLPEETKRLR